MNKKNKESKFWIYVLITIALIGIFLIGIYVFTPKCPECQVCPIIEEKALIDVQFDTWGAYEGIDEIYFDYRIYNYGNAEAKDISIMCKILDISNNVLYSITKYYGNLASTSHDTGEITTEKPFDIYNPDREVFAFCFAKECSNCEILYKRIPTLIEIYESERR